MCYQGHPARRTLALRVREGDKVYGTVCLIVLVLCWPFEMLFKRFQRERDPFPFGVNLNDLEISGLTHIQDFIHPADTPPCKFADVDQPFDTWFQFHERTKVGNTSDLPGDDSFRGISFNRC